MNPLYRHEFIQKNVELGIRLDFNIDAGSVVGKHFHDCIELLYIVNGKLEFHDNNKTLILTNNDFVVVNRMSIHSTKCVEGNTAILIQIPVDFLEKCMPEVRQYQFEVDIRSEDERIKTKLDKIREIMLDLLIANEFKVEGYMFRCYGLIFELFYILVHSFSKKVDYVTLLKSEKNMNRMKLVMDYVGEHYKEDVSLQTIADVVALNPVYFTRFFKQQTGITFLEYLNTIRIEHVYQDLLNTDLNVKDILEIHGCYNYKLFMKMFKSTYGETPKQFRINKLNR